jgi:cyanophycinase-like exopeptidase
MKFALPLLLLGALFGASSAATRAADFSYIRQGNPQDLQTRAEFGVEMLGGGDDLDEAFRWLCGKANGGDFLILRARGGADYNTYVSGLCRLNSVATLIVPSRKAAQNVRIAKIIGHAEAIFIAGGDQSLYLNYWKGTAVADAIQAHLAAGGPLGGTSAGLAVLGQFAYGALDDKPQNADLSSPQVLADPYLARVTLVRDFLRIPGLENVLTDSHFAKRDRMGRTLGFLARIVQDGWSRTPRAIAIDERSALLMAAGGRAKVVGPGRGVYFLQVTEAPAVCRPGQRLTFENIVAYRVPAGAIFDVRNWVGDGGEAYSISVESGQIRAGRAGNAPY